MACAMASGLWDSEALEAYCVFKDTRTDCQLSHNIAVKGRRIRNPGFVPSNGLEKIVLKNSREE